MIDWPLILAEHGPATWRTVFRLLGHHADALDCYQDTFVSAWQFAERNAVSDWAALLTSLATRRAIDRLRQRYRDRTTPLDAAPEPGGEADSPPRHAAAAELLDRVRESLTDLPDKQARAFWLSGVEGWPHGRIAEHLGVPPGEVRVLLHRARTRLRAALDPEGSTRVEDKE